VNAPATLHPFQRKGLGFAPFRLASVRRGGGCCAYCGAVISRLFIVSDVDGKEFSVGCDCIEKVAAEGRCDPQMVRDAKRLGREAGWAEWHARFTAARAAHPFKRGGETYRQDVEYRLSGCRPQAVWRKATVEVERVLKARGS
jgi:hypothetical protein